MKNLLWRRSIRSRLTLWYSLLVALLLALLMAALLLEQHFYSRDFYRRRLSAACAEAAEALRVNEDGPYFTRDFEDSEVLVCLLDSNGKLLLGKKRFGFAPRKGLLRSSARRDGGTWYVLDRAVRRNGVRYWVRCSMSSAATNQSWRTLSLALLICVPIVLLLTMLGGNLIAKRALKPLTEITATAESISDSGDLRQRIRLEGQTNEVERLAAAFNSMFERLQRSMEREKRFISDASHELRTPVSVINAQSEYALAPGTGAEEKDAALRVIHERSERAGRMLQQMLMLSRMDSQRLQLHREPLQLNRLVEGVTEELRAEAAGRNMELRCEAEEIEFEGDELLLTRMLTNLVQNAIQYGREGGHIDVTLARGEAGAQLCVRDDGPGIPEAEQSHVWERFYQLHKDGEAEGSGLGLPIVRWIVEAHGGSIRLESRPGAGCLFRVELPAGKPER